MAAWIFDAPAGVKDFSDQQRWHEAMADEAKGIVLELVATVVGKNSDDVSPEEIASISPQLAYIDPVAAPPAEPGSTSAISPWPAFPRAVKRRAPWTEYPAHPEDKDGSLRAAEDLGDEDHRAGVFVDDDGKQLALPVRHRQDEYMEWVSRRDQGGKLTKVIFVAEGYDYYSKLYEHDEQKVVEMYREFTEVATITADDLRARNGITRVLTSGGKRVVAEAGAFNPRNRFNIDPGIVHLSHRANSLGAEVNLAGVSGILRLKSDGNTVVSGADSEELLCCCEGGNPNRNSDPLISAQAYGLVMSGQRYTLANPVGLYIAGVESHRVETKHGDPVGSDWWKVVRGDGFDSIETSRVLRLELAPPAGSGLSLEDLVVDSVPVRFASQLASLLMVHLFVTTWARDGGGGGPAVSCSGTCCNKTGTAILEPSDGACRPGSTLKYSDLVIPPAGPKIALATAAVHSFNETPLAATAAVDAISLAVRSRTTLTR